MIQEFEKATVRVFFNVLGQEKQASQTFGSVAETATNANLLAFGKEIEKLTDDNTTFDAVLHTKATRISE